MRIMSKFITILLICCLFLSCKNEIEIPSTDTINILLPQDPERLNPVYDARSIGREVFQYIYTPVADFHPESLELTPILIKNLPRAQKEENGKFYYEIDLIEDAQWHDGKSITAEDYIFTIKSVLLPQTNAKSWKPVLAYINEISAVENDPYKIKVYVDEDYMLKLEIVSTIYLLPKHAYANVEALDKLTIAEIKAQTEEENMDASLAAFIEDFNDPKHYTTNILGNGPYKLTQWENDQFVKLKKVENYYGENYASNPFLQANIPNINFKIIADEMTSITALKDGALDVVKGLSAANFNELKNDIPQASFLNAPSTRYYYLSINNQNPILQDKSVRKALAKLVDVQGLIENIEFGYGTQLTGPLHPSQPYYDENLSNDIYDVEEAKTLLQSSGWTDSNNNDIIDKVVQGTREELTLDLLITGGELGQKIALVFQSEAKKVGIDINIVTKDIRRMRSENLYSYDYDLAALAEGQDIIPVDPYRRWHSENVKERGSNISGYKSETADSLITLIRDESDTKKREDLYEEFHRHIYENQPVIFLFSPTQKLFVGENFEATVTAKRPGYLANTFKIKPAKK